MNKAKNAELLYVIRARDLEIAELRGQLGRAISERNSDRVAFGVERDALDKRLAACRSEWDALSAKLNADRRKIEDDAADLRLELAASRRELERLRGLISEIVRSAVMAAVGREP